MIPTLIMVGAVFGRWWRVTLLVSAVSWPVLLVVTSAMSPGPGLAGAAGLAVLNTGAGVLLYQGIRAAAGNCGTQRPHGGAPDALGLPVRRWRG